jgi:hypothetical protein
MGRSHGSDESDSKQAPNRPVLDCDGRQKGLPRLSRFVCTNIRNAKDYLTANYSLFLKVSSGSSMPSADA